jgi:hypothetical protein
MRLPSWQAATAALRFVLEPVVGSARRSSRLRRLRGRVVRWSDRLLATALGAFACVHLHRRLDWPGLDRIAALGMLLFIHGLATAWMGETRLVCCASPIGLAGGGSGRPCGRGAGAGGR